MAMIYPLLCFALHVLRAAALEIDDSDGTYFSFTGTWNAITPTTPCSTCAAKPDAHHVHQGTWHDGSPEASGSIKFKGSSISLYGVSPPQAGSIDFSLDNQQQFPPYDPGGSSDSPYQYSQLFFHWSGDSAHGQQDHVLSFTLKLGSSGGGASLIDYAIIDDPPPSSTSSTQSPSSSATSSGPTATSSSTQSTQPASSSGQSKGAIIGGAVVGVLGLLLILAALFFLSRRRRRKSSAAGLNADGGETSEPYKGHETRESGGLSWVPEGQHVPSQERALSAAQQKQRPAGGNDVEERVARLEAQIHANAVPPSYSPH